MTTAAGFSTLAAWAREDKQSAYGVVATCGAEQQLPMISEAIEYKIDKAYDEAVRNQAGMGESEITGKQAAGPLSLRGCYRGLESVLASALGLCKYDSPATIAAGVYKHDFIPDEDLARAGWAAGDGVLAGGGLLAGDKKVRAATVCVDKTVSVWENASVMVQTMTLKGTSKGVFIDLDVQARDQLRATADNPDSSTWSIVDDDFLPVLFGDLTLWVGSFSTSVALDSSNAIGVSEIEIKLDNKLKIEQTSTSGLFFAEPARDGLRQVSGSFKLPRYENDDFLDALDAAAPLMAMLKFTGSAIGVTGHNRTLWIWLPRFTLDQAPAPTSGPGLVTMQLNFTAELPSQAPAGMPTNATKELLIQLQNDYATNPLK